MAVGALIGAYQEDDSGGLRALLPLAGRTLVEYQVRCAVGVGAAPVVVLVERIPPALHEAFERLRSDGISVVTVSDGNEAATRFDAGSMILVIGDGVAPTLGVLDDVAADPEPAVVTVPDDADHDRFERIDAGSRWAGIAIVDAATLSSTAAILGDWDLQSTLLRRTIQNGARRVAAPSDAAPLLVERADELADFERTLLTASRGARRDWASRYALGWIDDLATEQLMDKKVSAPLLVWSGVLLMIAAAILFTRGWLLSALALLLLSTPLDLLGERLARLRLRPLRNDMIARRLLDPAAGLALLGCGLWLTRHVSGWGAFVTALACIAFAIAAAREANGIVVPGELWLFARRNAILAVIPFAIFAAWTTAILALALYAAASFFYVQHVRHGFADQLTPH